MGKTKDVREAVESELNFDPLVDATNIAVKNINGEVALNGTVPSYPLSTMRWWTPPGWPPASTTFATTSTSPAEAAIRSRSRGASPSLDRLLNGEDEPLDRP